MQSALHISTSNSACSLSSQWGRHNKTQISLPLKQNLFLRRTLELPNSLKTSFHFEFEEEKLKKELESTTPTLLPVVIRQSDGVSRYFWDGNDLKLVSIDGKPFCFDTFDDFGDGCRRFLRGCRLGVRNFLLPREINDNYLEYVKWKFLHRVFSSALQVLATQAMFRAIGIGYARSLPSAAALNWVLKDGLGRLSRCIYTASLASAFDTNLKPKAAFVTLDKTGWNWTRMDKLSRAISEDEDEEGIYVFCTDERSTVNTLLHFFGWDKKLQLLSHSRVRFSTSVVFSLSIGVELMTPAFPQYFLLLASIANIAKQISLACYLATGTAVHRSFAVADNLGEVSAKAQIQQVCFDNLGLMLAAALNIMLKNNQRLQAGLPFVVYPIFTAIDLYGIYQSLNHVHLQTLTKDRLEIIMDTWIQLGYIPTPAEVSKKEGMNFFSSKGRLKWPIRIGSLNPKCQIPQISMLAMRSLSKDDFYFVCTEVSFHRFQRTEGILLCLREGSSTSDIIMGLLQACYIRERLPYRMKEEEEFLEGCEWFKMVDECKEFARADIKLVNGKMVELGWACKNILLSTDEQTRFGLVND